MSGSPDEDDLSKLSKLVQQLVYERIVKVVVRAGGAERNHDGAIWRPLQGNDIFVDLVPSLRVDLKDVYVYYCHHRPREREGTLRKVMIDDIETPYICLHYCYISEFMSVSLDNTDV